MPKITQRIVDAAKPDASRDVWIWDSELKGFGLRLKPTGTRSYLIQYRTPQGVQRRYAFARHPRLTASEARTEGRLLLGNVERGADPSALKRDARAALTVTALCDEYLAKAITGEIITRNRLPKKPSTLATDRGRIERHIKPLIGHRPVRDLTASDIRGFLNAVTAGKTKADVRTGPRGRAIVTGGKGTAARTVGLLGGILSFAVEQGYIASNPTIGVRRPAGERRIVNIDADQFRVLGKALVAAEDNGTAWQATAAIRLLALTGCRRGEIEKLRWQEVDAPGHCLRLGDTKTGASVRPIGREAVRLLKNIRARNESGDFVLPALRRSGGAYGGLPKAWLRITAGQPLAGLTPHGLRHTFASWADAIGCSVPTISSLLGHSAGGTTSRYIHAVDSALIASADKVSRAVWSAMTGESDGKVIPLRAG